MSLFLYEFCMINKKAMGGMGTDGSIYNWNKSKHFL